MIGGSCVSSRSSKRHRETSASDRRRSSNVRRSSLFWRLLGRPVRVARVPGAALFGLPRRRRPRSTASNTGREGRNARTSEPSRSWVGARAIARSGAAQCSSRLPTYTLGSGEARGDGLAGDRPGARDGPLVFALLEGVPNRAPGRQAHRWSLSISRTGISIGAPQLASTLGTLGKSGSTGTRVRTAQPERRSIDALGRCPSSIAQVARLRPRKRSAIALTRELRAPGAARENLAAAAGLPSLRGDYPSSRDEARRMS